MCVTWTIAFSLVMRNVIFILLYRFVIVVLEAAKTKVSFIVPFLLVFKHGMEMMLV